MIKFVEIFGEKFKDLFNMKLEVIELISNKTKTKEK